ncbi:MULTISPECIES: hypothetical protein [Citrobacter]|uniref:hypothetical protein n=1 Tax=Citrobacter TaxID=544 RepID=UPI000A37A747|nr:MULTISPECIES: hypothetical protein [Citrobacter]AYL62056.1 hypothetical protein CUC49_10580 [Citrobacter pasteurii]NTX82735.1 hypothetical protein [Citrobacter youngae]OUE79435.1 hypothetical protein AZ013_004481 [Citrobacter freundii]TKU20375.1 hypothetical protein FDX03_06605 [Citrobacter sp. wls827]
MKPSYEELEKKCALQQSKLAALNELMEGVEKACDIAKAGIENLQLQNEELAVQLANAESKCRELAAENAGLKNFIINDCHVAHIEPETFYEEEITRYVSADGYEPETPATDAFLAEVRAQGVEGFLKFCGEENSVFVETKAYYRSLSDAVDEFSAQLRQGVQS